jgi:hypothetical protein
LREIEPSREQWKTFWNEIEKTSLWHWKEHYDNLNILDGYSWSVKIEIGNYSIESYGSNDAPKDFKEFLNALENLTDKKVSNIH